MLEKRFIIYCVNEEVFVDAPTTILVDEASSEFLLIDKWKKERLTVEIKNCHKKLQW